MKNLLLIVMIIIIGFVVGVFTGCKKVHHQINSPLTGVKWILKSIKNPIGNMVSIEKPFSLLFHDNGEFYATVDCNLCSGTYTLNGNNSISFLDQIICTEVYCGPDSKDGVFHKALNSASAYEISSNQLVIYFNSNSGILNFVAE